MKVNCCRCGRNIGEITGKLLKGWAILCPDCNEWRGKHDSREAAIRPVEMPEFMKQFFK